MKNQFLTIAILVALVAAAAVTIVSAQGRAGLAAVRSATAKFKLVEQAEASGYVLVPGLDHCFDNLGIGAMGYHYINTGLLDTTLKETQPEAMVYAPGPNGKLQLGAVEYIVPADAWDAAGNTAPPQLHGHSLHLNESLGVYVLHAWIWKNNPAGMFEDWNPKVACPQGPPSMSEEQ